MSAMLQPSSMRRHWTVALLVIYPALLLQHTANLTLALKGSSFTMASQGEIRVLNAGQQVSLACDFQTDDFSLFNNPVIWNKDQRNEVTRVNMMGNIVDPYLATGRFHVDLHMTSPHYSVSLIIQELSLEDSGNYTCEVRAPGNKIIGSITYYLFVRAPVHEVHVFRGDSTGPAYSTPPAIACAEDQSTAISCVSIGGYPAPQLELFLGEQNITKLFSIRHSTQLLGVRGLKVMVYRTERYTHKFIASAKDDGKNVSCVATVPGLQPNISKAKLEVHYAPVIICQPASAYLGEKNAFMACEVEARPRVNFLYWTLDPNGTTVTEGRVVNEFWTLNMDRGPFKLATRLYLHVATPEVYHTYSVCAQNNIGITTQQVTLVQEYRATSVSSNLPIVGSPNDISDKLDSSPHKRTKPRFSSSSTKLSDCCSSAVLSMTLALKIVLLLNGD